MELLKAEQISYPISVGAREKVLRVRLFCFDIVSLNRSQKEKFACSDCSPAGVQEHK
jgi:hypothetical protein